MLHAVLNCLQKFDHKYDSITGEGEKGQKESIGYFKTFDI